MKRWIPFGIVTVLGTLLWGWLAARSGLPEGVFPGPAAVATAAAQELASGEIPRHALQSLFRYGVSFAATTLLGTSLGLVFWVYSVCRAALQPYVHFFRFVSPLAWIPIVILAFGVGHLPVIVLLFLATFFPTLAGSLAALERVPRRYLETGLDLGLKGWRLAARVQWPAALPEILAHLRIAAGVGWVVLVAAEMLAGDGGLGFAILDARNGMRVDLVLVYLVVIGLVGLGIDRVFVEFRRLARLGWSFREALSEEGA